MTKPTVKEINDKIFNLLKEPLQLHDMCVSFTLTVELDKYPLVEESYLSNMDHYIKHGEWEIDTEEKQIDE
ncbi:MAG: hypothetical protein R3250_17245 [Melioribacteraceae bacterium]|nr:hypothetical protein [Melioribacteraceae bacterium]